MGYQVRGGEYEYYERMDDTPHPKESKAYKFLS